MTVIPGSELRQNPVPTFLLAGRFGAGKEGTEGVVAKVVYMQHTLLYRLEGIPVLKSVCAIIRHPSLTLSVKVMRV